MTAPSRMTKSNGHTSFAQTFRGKYPVQRSEWHQWPRYRQEPGTLFQSSLARVAGATNRRWIQRGSFGRGFPRRSLHPVSGVPHNWMGLRYLTEQAVTLLAHSLLRSSSSRGYSVTFLAAQNDHLSAATWHCNFCRKLDLISEITVIIQTR